jgi:hypothetical protein
MISSAFEQWVGGVRRSFSCTGGCMIESLVAQPDRGTATLGVGNQLLPF